MRPGLLVRPRFTVRLGPWTLVDGERVQNASERIAPDEKCEVVTGTAERVLVRSEGSHAWVDRVDLTTALFARM